MAATDKPQDNHYRLVHANSARELQHLVNRLIEEGFVPIGAAFVAESVGGEIAHDYFQTMAHRSVIFPASK